MRLAIEFPELDVKTLKEVAAAWEGDEEGVVEKLREKRGEMLGVLDFQGLAAVESKKKEAYFGSDLEKPRPGIAGNSVSASGRGL